MKPLQRSYRRILLVGGLTLLAAAGGVWAQAEGTASRTIYEQVNVHGEETDAEGNAIAGAFVSAEQTTTYPPGGSPQRASTVNGGAIAFKGDGFYCFGGGFFPGNQEGAVNVSANATAGTAHAAGTGVLHLFFGSEHSPRASVPATVKVRAMGRAGEPLPPVLNPDGTTTAFNVVTDGHVTVQVLPPERDPTGCGPMEFTYDVVTGNLVEIRQ